MAQPMGAYLKLFVVDAPKLNPSAMNRSLAYEPEDSTFSDSVG
jgi:hypothetical protein